MSRESQVEIAIVAVACCWCPILADQLPTDAQETFASEKKEKRAEGKAVPTKVAAT